MTQDEFDQTLDRMFAEAQTEGAQPGGRIDIRWTADDGLLSLSWRESGGPAVKEPRQQGFGSRLVEASTREARLRYPSTGFEADLVLVLAERAAEPLEI